MAMNVKFLRGLIASYNALETKDADTLYFCTNGALYLGENKIANWTDLTEVNAAIKALQDAGYQNASQVSSAISTALTGYYTKEEIETKLSNLGVPAITERLGTVEGKVTDLETWKNALPVYVTKADYDAAMALKADKSELFTKEAADALYDATGAAATAEENAKKYSDEKLNAVVEQYLTGDGAADTIDTLNEIAEWINSDTAGVSQIIKDVAANTQAIADEKSARETADNTINGEIDAIQLQLNGISAGDGTVKAAIDAAKSGAIADADAKLANKLDTSIHTEYVNAHANDYTNAQIDSAISTATTDMATNSYVNGELAKKVDNNTYNEYVTAHKDDYTNTQIDSAISTATTDMATKTYVSDNYVAKAGYVEFTTEEKNKLAGLSNYDDTALAGRVSTLEGEMDSAEGRLDVIEAKPAMDITSDDISAWNAEKGAKELTNTKTTLTEVKNTYIGDTNAKLVDVVKAVNQLAEGSSATDKVVESVATNVKDIAAQLTWGTF